MKTKNLILSGLLSLFLTPFAQAGTLTGTGKIVDKTISTGIFNSVVLASSAEVEICSGSESSIVLSDYENLIDSHTFAIDDKKLIISKKPGVTLSNSVAKIKITVSQPVYSAIITGSGDMQLNNINSLKELSISGSGIISALSNGSYENLNLSISGSGKIKMNGKSQYTTVTLSGSGYMDLSQLQSELANCKISGSGDVQVYASNKLLVLLQGSGDITYYGKPEISKSISGSGRVKCSAS